MLENIKNYIRPLQGALMLLAGATVSGILELFSAGLGVQFTTGVAGWFRAIPDSYYTLLGALAVAGVVGAGGCVAVHGQRHAGGVRIGGYSSAGQAAAGCWLCSA